jgi:hypothetical protein
MQAELSQSNCDACSTAAAATASDRLNTTDLNDGPAHKQRVVVPKPGVEIFIGGWVSQIPLKNAAAHFRFSHHNTLYLHVMMAGWLAQQVLMIYGNGLDHLETSQRWNPKL